MFEAAEKIKTDCRVVSVYITRNSIGLTGKDELYERAFYYIAFTIKGIPYNACGYSDVASGESVIVPAVSEKDSKEYGMHNLMNFLSKETARFLKENKARNYSCYFK